MSEDNTSSTDGSTSDSEVKNSSNDYTPFYSDIVDDHRMSTDTPDVYIMVSKQKRGTETAASPYADQDDGDESDDNTDETNSSAGSTNSNTATTSTT